MSVCRSGPSRSSWLLQLHTGVWLLSSACSSASALVRANVASLPGMCPTYSLTARPELRSRPTRVRQHSPSHLAGCSVPGSAPAPSELPGATPQEDIPAVSGPGLSPIAARAAGVPGAAVEPGTAEIFEDSASYPDPADAAGRLQEASGGLRADSRPTVSLGVRVSLAYRRAGKNPAYLIHYPAYLHA